MTALEAGSVPGVVMLCAAPVLTTVVQPESEYTLYVTVPVAVEVFVPVKVAVSLTAVLSGTEILAPD